MKKIINWLNIISLAIIVLGLFHLMATPLVLGMFEWTDPDEKSIFLFMYLAAGIGTILPGLISKIQINAIKESSLNARFTVIVCSLYTFILGIGAIILLTNNPFAYIAVVLGIALVIPALIIKKHYS